MEIIPSENKFLISKKTSWNNLILFIDNEELKLIDNNTGRGDSILFCNINKKNGYLKWNWKDKYTPCKSHKISKNGGVNYKTIKYIYDYLSHDIGLVTELHLMVSKGYDNELECDSKLLDILENSKIEFYNINSATCVDTFNNLVLKNKPVILLFHATC